MTRKFWWPTSMSDQVTVVTNLALKIAGYGTVLSLTPAQVTAIVNLCEAFIGSFNATEAAKTTMLAMTRWRDAVMNGEAKGAPAGPSPVFPVDPANTYTQGVVAQLFAYRDLIVALPGYTLAIGEDLGIVGPESSGRPVMNLKPEFKNVSANGTTVNVTGSMQGQTAMRVEYAPKGGEFKTVAFLTNTPGGFQITPTKPGEPETGHIRAVYIKRNAEVGNFSAEYPVTVS